MDVILPELGEDIQMATVACWHVKPGEEVKQDQELVELVTDKASFNVEAPRSGIIQDIFFQEGEEAPIGAKLAFLNPSSKDSE